jgi:hypothetical protein
MLLHHVSQHLRTVGVAEDHLIIAIQSQTFTRFGPRHSRSTSPCLVVETKVTYQNLNMTYATLPTNVMYANFHTVTRVISFQLDLCCPP